MFGCKLYVLHRVSFQISLKSVSGKVSIEQIVVKNAGFIVIVRTYCSIVTLDSQLIVFQFTINACFIFTFFFCEYILVRFMAITRLLHAVAAGVFPFVLM